jgi:hypothetical protein
MHSFTYTFENVKYRRLFIYGTMEIEFGRDRNWVYDEFKVALVVDKDGEAVAVPSSILSVESAVIRQCGADIQDKVDAFVIED